MKLLLIIFLLSIPLFGSLNKRSGNRYGEPSSKRMRLNNEVVKHIDLNEEASTWDSLPIEIIIEIFSRLWDTLTSKGFVANPLMKYRLVSEAWNNALNDHQFMRATMNHPRYALSLLKSKHCQQHRDYNSLLMAAKDFIGLDDSLQCLIKMRNLKTIVSFGIITAMKKPLRSRHYDFILGLASRRNYIFQHPGDIDHKPLDREDVLYHFAVRNRRPLHDNLLRELFILLALEDCFKPGRYNSIHRYFNRAILNLWVEGSKTDKKSSNLCLRHLRRFNLPKSNLNAMFRVMEFPIFIAAYIGDLKFLKFIQLHWPTIKTSSPSLSQTELLNVVEQLQLGTINEFPVEKLESQIQLIENGFLVNPFLFGFSLASIDERTKLILNTADLNLSDNLKEVLSQYLLSSA